MTAPDTIEQLLSDIRGRYAPFMPQELLERAEALQHGLDRKAQETKDARR